MEGRMTPRKSRAVCPPPDGLPWTWWHLRGIPAHRAVSTSAAASAPPRVPCCMSTSLLGRLESGLGRQNSPLDLVPRGPAGDPHGGLIQQPHHAPMAPVATAEPFNQPRPVRRKESIRKSPSSIRLYQQASLLPGYSRKGHT